MSSLPYRADIDGLRAFAVLPVLFFHLGSRWIPGGYLGVDVFFVISGYLICSIILRQFQTETFTFQDFWMRRAKRLFPVSATVISISMIVGYFTLFEDEWKSMALQAITSLVFVSNFYFWKNTNDYWGEQAEDMPFLHTWSLSIEEQFYLLFPLFLVFVGRRLGRRFLISIAVIFTASLVLSIIGSVSVKSVNFYLLPMRAWELLAGGVLAATRMKNVTELVKPNSWLSTLGILLITLSYCYSWNRLPSATYGQVLAVGGTVLFLWKSAPNNGVIGRIISLVPVVYIGRISYSLYLWHWPTIVISHKIGEFHPAWIAGLSVILASFSYHFVEQRTRNLPNQQFARIIGVAAAVLAITLLMPNYLKRGSVHFDIPDFWSHVNLEPPYIGKFQNQQGDYKTGLLMSDLTEGKGLDILVIGDSHSLMFLPAIKAVADEERLTLAFYGADGGTSPFLVAEGENPEDFYHGNGWTPSQREAFDRHRLDFIMQYQPRTIIVCGRWENWIRFGRQFMIDHINALIKSAEDSEFIFVGQPPILPFGDGGFDSGELDSPMFRGFFEQPYFTLQRTKANKLLQEFAAVNERYDFLPTEKYFLNVRGVNFLEGRTIFYKDDDHLSVAGAVRCKDSFSRLLKGY